MSTNRAKESVMWQITASVEIAMIDGWTSTRDLPIFYLDENVQGITQENGAVKVAENLILACAERPNFTMTHIVAVKVAR
jgi:hypothetical protein